MAADISVTQAVKCYDQIIVLDDLLAFGYTPVLAWSSNLHLFLRY